jgi:hypothetical protein
MERDGFPSLSGAFTFRSCIEAVAARVQLAGLLGTRDYADADGQVCPHQPAYTPENADSARLLPRRLRPCLEVSFGNSGAVSHCRVAGSRKHAQSRPPIARRICGASHQSGTRPRLNSWSTPPLLHWVHSGQP